MAWGETFIFLKYFNILIYLPDGPREVEARLKSQKCSLRDTWYHHCHHSPLSLFSLSSSSSWYNHLYHHCNLIGWLSQNDFILNFLDEPLPHFMIIHTIMLITTINHVWSSGRPGRQSTWSWVLDGWDPREKVEANHEDQFFHSWHLSDHDDHSNKLLDCWCSSSTLILPPKGGMRSIDRNAWASEAAFQAGIVLLRVALMFRVSFFIQKLKMGF